MIRLHRSTLALLACCTLASCGGGTTTTDMSAVTVDMTSAGTPSCTDYCANIMANCNNAGSDAGVGATEQYTTLKNCMNSCKAFPVGTSADTSGDTLGCRSYHAMAAKGDPKTHCPHAGPGGGGLCGTNCQGYCQLAMLYCTSANMAKVYDTLADCMAVCAATPDDVPPSIAVQDGKHVACLLYHSQEASSDPPGHCIGDLMKVDGGANSITCM